MFTPPDNGRPRWLFAESKPSICPYHLVENFRLAWTNSTVIGRGALTQLTLHVENVERRITYGILFILCLLFEYINLEYEHIHVI